MAHWGLSFELQGKEAENELCAVWPQKRKSIQFHHSTITNSADFGAKFFATSGVKTETVRRQGKNTGHALDKALKCLLAGCGRQEKKNFNT